MVVKSRQQASVLKGIKGMQNDYILTRSEYGIFFQQFSNYKSSSITSCVREKLSLEISLSSSKRSPGRQTRAEKVMHNRTASEGERMDQCQTGSEKSPEDMSSTAMPYQVVMQDSKDMEEVKQITLNAFPLFALIISNAFLP